ncbi:hypothetical protein B0H16DRAFT_1734382 [Mycena metata]|uniref:Uncharacterized protein n=1 Tax=Mycena metata TaxID=1033252 RepID=A0AAD7HX06_9AGAR|nr:hypothetical protein B0H16DRAFT_1734382 [Mycena metata]
MSDLTVLSRRYPSILAPPLPWLPDERVAHGYPRIPVAMTSPVAPHSTLVFRLLAAAHLRAHQPALASPPPPVPPAPRSLISSLHASLIARLLSTCLATALSTLTAQLKRQLGHTAAVRRESRPPPPTRHQCWLDYCRGLHVLLASPLPASLHTLSSLFSPPSQPRRGAAGHAWTSRMLPKPCCQIGHVSRRAAAALSSLPSPSPSPSPLRPRLHHHRTGHPSQVWMPLARRASVCSVRVASPHVETARQL